jgi:hypothetical protein
MSGVLRIVLIIVVILAALVGASFFLLPSTATSTQTVTIARPAANVLAYLASAPAGQAAGEGVTQTVTSSDATQVVATLTYAEGQTATATYAVRPEGDGSVVAITVEQPLGMNPIARLQGMGGGKARTLLDGVTAALTAQTETIPAFNFANLRYDIVDPQPRPFMFFEATTTQDPAEIKEGVAQALLLVRPTLARFGLTEAGRPIAVEMEWNPTTNEYRFRAGLPYTGTPSGDIRGIVRIGETPVGQAIRVTYEGPETKIIPVYDQIESMIGAARLTMGKSYEVYLDEPSQAGGSASREIYVMVEGDTALLTRLFPTTSGRAQTGVDGQPSAAPAPATADPAAAGTAAPVTVEAPAAPAAAPAPTPAQ